MNPKELAESRAIVIERAINVETMLDAIISQHYIGKVTKNFVFEVEYLDVSAGRAKQSRQLSAARIGRSRAAISFVRGDHQGFRPGRA